MTISTITRNFNGVDNLVQFDCDNTFDEITTPGFLTREDIINFINLINKGPFKFFVNDYIFITYLDGSGQFSYSSDNNCFVLLLDQNGIFTYNPTMSFTTPGDLTVAYANVTGTYFIIGKQISLNVSMICTPTYTTSTGSFRVFAPLIRFRYLGGSAFLSSNIIYPAGATSLSPIMNSHSNIINIRGLGSSFNNDFTISQFPSGVQFTITLALMYLTD